MQKHQPFGWLRNIFTQRLFNIDTISYTTYNIRINNFYFNSSVNDDGTAEYVIEKNLLAMGFNGIPVALLASSNPIGVIFSSLFISYIQVGGEALQRYQFSSEIINIIISAIIYLSAFAFLIKLFIEKIFTKKKREEEKILEKNEGEVQS